MADKNKSGLTRYYHLMIIPVGVLINFLGVSIAHRFDLPLYLDSIGSILASALGGYFPGIVVGFASNLINGISDPITIYYGIISILLALATGFLTRFGAFRKFRMGLLLVLILTFIGGVIGSVLTWMLYGFSFGSGISAPYAIALYENYGISKFPSELTADVLIDLADKTVSMLVSVGILKLLPRKFIELFPFGHYILGSGEIKSAKKEEIERRHTLVHSLRAKMLVIIISAAATLGILATAISYRIYCDTMYDRFLRLCDSAVVLISEEIDGDKVDGFLESLDVSDSDYAEAEKQLYKIKKGFPEIKYMYVYQMREDGCHVVLDIDTEDLEAEELGAVVPYDDYLSLHIDELLSGSEIEPAVTDDSYGWLLTCYKPIYDSSGRCVCYAAVDVDMEEIIIDRSIFFIKMLALVFGFAIILFIITVWLADKHLINPINALTRSADLFAFGNEKDRESSVEQLRRLDIATGDEVELLYHSFASTMTDIAGYIDTISSLQENTMICFANLVESRDTTTGQHIKRTALLSNILARELYKEGKYPDIVNEAYIESVTRSAPLHDVGKIAIPDAILSKPGRLTSEEFEIMKTHVTAGREIIADLMEHTEGLEYIREAQNMAAYHHERWDGSGYAYGLKGEEIPLSARIMAVSDVFDALTSKRSYKPPFSSRDALDIIVSESGSHFDPTVVEAFINAFDEITEQLDEDESEIQDAKQFESEQPRLHEAPKAAGGDSDAKENNDNAAGADGGSDSSEA